MYYWTLLNKSETELAKQVFQIQNKFSVKDDWVKQVKEDLDELEIKLTENEISKMKYEAFKKVVKSKLNEKFFEYLISLKLIHTKTQNLYSYKLQAYLESENLTYKQKQLLFSLRTRSINVKTNYKNKYRHSNLLCTLCDDKLVESESHLLECKSTRTQLGNIGDARYEDIFSPEISRQEKITKIFEKVVKLRQMLSCDQDRTQKHNFQYFLNFGAVHSKFNVLLDYYIYIPWRNDNLKYLGIEKCQKVPNYRSISLTIII